MLSKDFPTLDFQTANGRFVRLERLDWSKHLDGLFACLGGPDNAEVWRWLGDLGPYENHDINRFRAEFEAGVASEMIPWQTAVVVSHEAEEILGMASYLRIRPSAGSAEVGFVSFSPKLQRTPHSTEAQFLMMSYVFDDMGYRRYEWKCNDKNKPSLRSAKRLGFTYEGTFRQDQIAKGENRDTAWFSIIDSEWPANKAAFETWLAPENFDVDGQQIKTLDECRSL